MRAGKSHPCNRTLWSINKASSPELKALSRKKVIFGVSFILFPYRHWRTLCLTLVFALASIGCQPQAVVEKELAKAQKLLTEGEIAAATAKLQSLYEKHPQNALILEELAFALVRQDNYLSSARYFNELGKEFPEKSDYFLYAAKNFERIEKFPEAIEAYQNYLHHNPTSAKVWQTIATLFQKLNRLQEALIAYHRSYNLEPQSAIATQIGLLYHQSDNPLQAEDWFRRAISLNPKVEVEAWRGLILEAIEKRQFSQAESLIAEALMQQPDVKKDAVITSLNKQLKQWRSKYNKLLELIN